MPGRPLDPTLAVVVRTVDYGESDRIVTLLARRYGKLAAIARGARRSQRRFGPGLAACAIGEVALRERAGSDLVVLERFDLTIDPSPLAQDLARLAHAAYVCELARELTAPHDACAEVFDLVAEMLGLLVHPDCTPRAETLRVFELALLGALGLAPRLDACAACGAALGDQAPATFDAGRGLLCDRCGHAPLPVPAAVRHALVHASALGLRDAGTAPALPAAVADTCRELLAQALTRELGRRLRSVEFIAKVRSS
jgi:DNA repair protein RecO (recombination protein O)